MEEHIFVGTLNMAYSNRRYFNVRELWGSKIYLRVNNKSLICKKEHEDTPRFSQAAKTQFLLERWTF